MSDISRIDLQKLKGLSTQELTRLALVGLHYEEQEKAQAHNRIIASAIIKDFFTDKRIEVQNKKCTLIRLFDTTTKEFDELLSPEQIVNIGFDKQVRISQVLGFDYFWLWNQEPILIEARRRIIRQKMDLNLSTDELAKAAKMPPELLHNFIDGDAYEKITEKMKRNICKTLHYEYELMWV
jgi:hypothetical protein